jgi:predicted TPR repeat methyltransferase
VGLGFRHGIVVNFGYHSGILASIVSDSGCLDMGIDISNAMVAIARERAPEAEFYLRSFVSADLPACVFDERNGTQARGNLFRRA